ncbi:hypothetical protein C9374_009082 [Naegleria lovaniensis]|uniref:NAD(P)-dependent oxidoreductase n=1 Tax=Naegleria lovaniensis TaxID=51637 RepID=A0AA88GI18_NAELO|nr:uncharacterized protein C9374_009082 [Naegleria lovaniensis]KAG2377566.1 hypothetical protein C9374_009082 [Naegleria lovaniensis]
MKSALLGYTGFVGSNIHAKSESTFQDVYNSKNLKELKGKEYDLIVSAACPAKKWIANKEPEQDLQAINDIISCLDGVKCQTFVLISTIDVYPVLSDKDEDFDCSTLDNHAYGKNRLYLEKWVASKFENHVILRLPALFGPNLAKNYIYDLMHDNNLNQINPNTSFQWYNVERLYDDIQTVLKYNKQHQGSEIRVVNMFPQPLHTSAFVKALFSEKADKLKNPMNENVIDFSYNLKTKHAKLFGSDVDGYIDNASNVLNQIVNYVNNEKSKNKQ